MYIAIFLYYGLLTILTQLVVFRELSVLFYGNELFLGTFLSSWLFWVGLGSFLARRLLNNGRSATAYFSYAFLAVSALFPLMILVIRASKSIFPFGEFIGPVGTILYTFSVMSALCLVIGGQFSLACAVASERMKPETVIGRVYLYEALGASAGGVLFTYILIGSVPTFIIAMALSAGCIFAGISLFIRKMSAVRAALIVMAIILAFVNLKVEPSVNRIEWSRYQFIGQKEARNSTFSLVNMGSIKNIFEDGMLSASFPNPESYEPAAHWPLLATAAPRRILIIGDSSLGLLKETIKHNPEIIDYVVQDGSFLDLAAPYLKNEDIRALKDPAVRIHSADLRVFVRESKDRYDDVIINMPEVPTLKANRAYTAEFFERIRAILKSDGIVALSVSSSENYLSMRTRIFNASVYRTLKSVFNTVEVIPGDTITFLSGSSGIDLRPETIMRRLNDRKISGRYVIPSYIEYKLEPKRRAELTKLLLSTTGARINRDFKPTTCYYFTEFWVNKFASPVGYVVAGLLLIAMLSGILMKRRSPLSLGSPRVAALICILGFVGMLLELTLLLGYQIISGYVYWQMGVLFAAFMSGLFLGSLAGNLRKDDGRERHTVYLISLTALIAGVSACAAYLLPRLAGLSTIQNMYIFTASLAFIGGIVGASFVIAGLLITGGKVLEKAGSLYAADLWGSALGAILSTNLIVPVFGIIGALNISAVIGLAGLAIFFILPRSPEL